MLGGTSDISDRVKPGGTSDMSDVGLPLEQTSLYWISTIELTVSV